MRRDTHLRLLQELHLTATPSISSSVGSATQPSPNTSPLNTSPLTTSQLTTPNNPSTTPPPLSTPVEVTLTVSGSTFITTSYSAIPQSVVSSPSSYTPIPTIINAQVQPVCIGNGIDASGIGVLATLIFALAVGAILWLLFAILRPRFRQLYGLREWFVVPDLRPAPLGGSLWAFLFPPVPLVPDCPSNVENVGQSARGDAELFPSDEELAQRTLWVSFLLVLGWAILALVGALPLYLVDAPCLANSHPRVEYGGRTSVLYDLSLLRLLKMLDEGESLPPGNSLSRRLIVDGVNKVPNAYARLIVLVVILLVVALLPAIWKLFKEFTNLANYRQRWMEVKCDGLEMGWLSLRNAPGFTGWGESRFKNFLVKSGLSSSLTPSQENSVTGRRGASTERRGKKGEVPEVSHDTTSLDEKARPQVDIQGLFSIGATSELTRLLDERDQILNNLEVAETRYISSFQFATPDASLASVARHSVAGVDENGKNPNIKLKISRPRALAGSYASPRDANGRDRTESTMSYLAPSSYYKLRGVQGVSGGKMASESTTNDEPVQPVEGNGQSLSQTIKRRLIGTRFLEVNRDSAFFGRLPLGSHVEVDRHGKISPVASTKLPVISRGPNHAANDPDASEVPPGEDDGLGDADEWSLVPSATALDQLSDENDPGATVDGATPATRRRPEQPAHTEHRETFPMRPSRTKREATATPEVVPPPHLRLQAQQPFFRPISGLDHDALGGIYGDIRFWRSRLKAINAEIAGAQQDRYEEIANGRQIKGWLFIGRGVRFFPGIEMIEGRSKDDIRYDEIQNGGGIWSTILFWVVAVMIGIFLGVGVTAAAGLALAGAPDVAHYLDFLTPIAQRDDIPSGLTTSLVPALLFTLFTVISLAGIHYAATFSGSVSVSHVRLMAFKAAFLVLCIVTGFWLVAVGSTLFGMHALEKGISRSENVADGAIAMAVFLLVLVINVAVISPALLMLQPFHLWRMTRRERAAVTPRQHFRAMYPRAYNPTFAIGCCVLAVVFVCAFSLIFPLISIPVVILLFLTLIAHRFLIGYVYARKDGQTGGLLQLWILRRFGTLLALQPILLGLILLSRRLWVLGGVLLGAAVIIIVAVETFTERKTRLPGIDTLSPITRDSLETFGRTARRAARPQQDSGSSTSPTSPRSGRPRGSIASVLEMMSITLAVMPSRSARRGAIPLQTEALDDLISTERAARTHPDAPPRLPPLPFLDHAEEMSGILYPPELTAPPPTIWLPNDPAGVARSEAFDLQRYHDLATTIDVRTNSDVLPRERPSSRLVGRD